MSDTKRLREVVKEALSSFTVPQEAVDNVVAAVAPLLPHEKAAPKPAPKPKKKD